MTLYHYTSGQGIHGIVKYGELRCSNVNFLNDPSEQSYFQQLLKTLGDRHPEAEKIYSTLFNYSFQDAVIDPFESFVASFSKNDDSLSMWNYYAKGNGYNIGLDIDKVIKANENDNASIKKIELEYDQSKQLDATLKYILRHRANFERYNELDEKIKETQSKDDHQYFHTQQIELIQDFNIGIHNLKLRYKHQAYESEEEVRLLISENEIEQKTTKFRMTSNGVFVEYFPLKLELSSNLRSVTIHPLSGPLHLEGTKKFISSKNYNSNPKIKRSEIPFREV